MKSKKLSTIPKIKSGFTAPESYFESFSVNLESQLNKSKVVPLWRSPILYAACIIAVVITTALVFVNKQDTPDAATIENYLLTMEEISDHEITEALSEKDLEQLTVNLQLNEEEIEQNLSQEGMMEALFD
jgi:hypothetical protein